MAKRQQMRDLTIIKKKDEWLRGDEIIRYMAYFNINGKYYSFPFISFPELCKFLLKIRRANILRRNREDAISDYTAPAAITLIHVGWKKLAKWQYGNAGGILVSVYPFTKKEIVALRNIGLRIKMSKP